MSRQTTGNTGSQAPLGNPRPRSSASSGTTPCPAYADLLVDLSDGDLSGEQHAAVMAHVATCGVCRSELARLDASLAQLRSSRGEYAAARPARASRRPSWTTPAAAAIGACLLLAAVGGWFATRPIAPPPVAIVPKVIPESPKMAAAPVMSQADALRHIALLEQQARLQTSLDLMPQAAWYDQQRESNQRLLDGFKAATDATLESSTTPTSGETL